MMTLAALALALWTPRQATAQWTVSYVVDNDLATAALVDPARVERMGQAVERAKERLEDMFGASTGNMVINIDWTPSSAGSVADAVPSLEWQVPMTNMGNRLLLKAEEDGESIGERLLYENWPQGTTSIRHSSTISSSVNAVAIPNSLNKHLGFGTTTNLDGTIRFTPPTPDGIRWQFWEKSGDQLPGHEVFEAVLLHETFHVMGILSRGDSTTTPTLVTAWDMFRFDELQLPQSWDDFRTFVRELRPTAEASAVQSLGIGGSAYKLSRGTRTGGDEKQPMHWRAFSRLTPPVAIGVMDPSASGAIQATIQDRMLTRADVEAVDVIGWNANVPAISFANAGGPQLVAPIATAQVPPGTDLTFEWEETSFRKLSVYIFSGTVTTNDDPVKVFYRLPAGTTSATLSASEGLAPGLYTWSVVGSTQVGYVTSEDRQFVVLAGCDPIDFNGDGLFPDDQDLVDFLAVSAGGVCSTGACNDIDFNNDGLFPDDSDLIAFLTVSAGGSCL